MRRLVAAASLFALLLLLTPLPAIAQGVVSTFASAPAVRGMALDASGRLYASSRGLNIQGGTSGRSNIRLYTPPSNVASIFANSADGLDDPIKMAFDNSGSLMVSDYVHMIHRITPAGIASVFATPSNPHSMTCDGSGDICVGEYATRKILKIAPDGTVSTYVNQLPGVRLGRGYGALGGWRLDRHALRPASSIRPTRRGTTSPTMGTASSGCSMSRLRSRTPAGDG